MNTGAGRSGRRGGARQGSSWRQADRAHAHPTSHLLCDLGPVHAIIAGCCVCLGLGLRGDSGAEHLVSWGERYPHKGQAGGMLTILPVSLIAEGSEVLVQGFQLDACGIMPALPGIQQQPVVSRDGQDVDEL